MAMAFRGFGLPELSPEGQAAGIVAPKQIPQDRRKFGAVDAIGLIGDALQSFGGGRPTYTPILQAQNERRQALEDAAAQRQAQVQDWIYKEQYKAAHPDPSPIARDVAAYQALTPEQRAAYGELQDLRAGPTTVQLPNGFVYSGPRSGIGAALGGGQTPQPAPQGVPAPALGENGLPSSLTPEQYDATVKAMGQAKTDAWLARNGIPVSKTLPNGMTAYRVNGKWYDNPEGR